MEKPEWLCVSDLIKKDHRWSASSRHDFYFEDKHGSDIEAFSMVQEVNMAGNYWRLFLYIGGKRYFDSLQCARERKKELVAAFMSLQVGDKVSLFNQVFTCVQIDCDSYIKAFERAPLEPLLTCEPLLKLDQ